MFDNITGSLDNILKTIKGERKISEIKIAEIEKELRRTLLNADVDYKVTNEFVKKSSRKGLRIEG